MTEKTEGGLTATEEAYFETGGETALDVAEPAAPEAQQQEQQPEQPEHPQPEGEAAQRDEKGRFVPHGALHAEREEHKKTRSELNELREKWARIEERMQWMQQTAPQPQQQEETPPDPNQDIFAALKYEREKREALEKRIAEEANERAKANETQQAERQIWSYWEQDAQQYTRENADFPNAAKWLSDFRDKQLTAFAAVDPQFSQPGARNAQIEAELKQIVAIAAQQKKSAAQLVYEIAKGYGYAPQAQAQNLQLPEQLQKVAKAQEASKSLSQAPGRAESGETSLETIMSMGRGEFEVWVKDPKNERLFNRLMGA